MYSVAKLGRDSVNLDFFPVLKPHTDTLYILRDYTDIVYVNGTTFFKDEIKLN